ncbi:mannosyl-oligosaccharide glucosidase isoform X1 [Ctenocephalides felis]|uniref:mannosyl-oligosaccharide glucosidase isoform X1 n=1 Tax=Ctenocephalides felis TaxID=7515 RepID=UPI000E6E5669|nr:mannosyl-oligosaccharide glucosidase isoform X1 [Ctenocephalides felis]
MTRQRKNKPPVVEKAEVSRNGNNSNTPKNATKKAASNNKVTDMSKWKTLVGCICLLVALGFGYMGYLETRVNTPFDDQKMVPPPDRQDMQRFWGSYRPGAYFGLKTRDPLSLVTGLMWYFPQRLRPGGDGVRHWCEQSDELARYGWLQHDGRNFGYQEIIDGQFEFKTSFVKMPDLGTRGGVWTARVSVDSKRPTQEEVSLIWYTALDERDTKGSSEIKTYSARKSLITGMQGYTKGLGEFTISLYNHTGTITHESYLSTITPGLHVLRDTLMTGLRLVTDRNNKQKKFIALAGELLEEPEGMVDPNFIATQITVRTPFEFDVVFETDEVENNLKGEEYTKVLEEHRKKFEDKFEDLFGLKKKGFSEKQISFAQASLANMIGSVGYFYGSSKVKSEYTKEPVPYWKAPLYTGVPSRSFFPRGFLWDEGFHNLLISTWDLDISLDIMEHWFDLMNVEGWIPREQILGSEALSKVPDEFVTQRNTNANPPTFFLTLKSILENYSEKLIEDSRLQRLERLYPRLQAWFNWFNTTQKGEMSGSYRWRGRDSNTRKELNPKTLTSGLDDYPRASHPDDTERHLDLRCWLALASSVLCDLTQLLGLNAEKYQQTYEMLSDQNDLDKLHWSQTSERYSDYGLHSDNVELRRDKVTTNSQGQIVQSEKVRVTLKKPTHRFVDSAFGYNSLFPLILQILPSNSPRLKKVIEDVYNPQLLWSPHGVRSLSKSSPLYKARNTEHDPPYWRGQIWLNINYLLVKSLYHYGYADNNTGGETKQLAQKVYKELRQNLIQTVYKEYERTGYIWEQYDDNTGQGKGCKPFNGWTALITLIMAEKY